MTITADSEATSDERAQKAFFIVEPNAEQLVEIGGLLDAGGLVVGMEPENGQAHGSAVFP